MEGPGALRMLLLFSCSVVSDSLQPLDCSTPGFPVHHHLLELAQTHVHWVGDAIQPSHSLSSPSPPAFNLSQHQGLFQCCYVWSKYSLLCNMFHDALHIQWPQYWSFSISPSNEYSGLISFMIDWFNLLKPRDSQESSPAPQFEIINSSALSLLYGPTHILTWLLEKPELWLHGSLSVKWCLCFLICCLG